MVRGEKERVVKEEAEKNLRERVFLPRTHYYKRIYLILNIQDSDMKKETSNNIS